MAVVWRLALPVLALTLPVPLGAQDLGLRLGDSARVQIPPGAAVRVPLAVDQAGMGAVRLATFQGRLAWESTRLRFDSLRSGDGWQATATLDSALRGVVRVSASGVGLGTSVQMAVAHFTALPSAGGTRVALTPSRADDQASTNLLSAMQTRGLDVCIAIPGRWGEVTDDDVVNIIDAQQIARSTVGLSVTRPSALAWRGDATGDGSINIIDAQQVARFTVGLSVSAVRINTAVTSTPSVSALLLSTGPAGPLAPGRFFQLVGDPLDAAGVTVAGCPSFIWSSSNPTVASVDATGRVSAISAGTATITGSSGGRSATVGVQVASPVAAVEVTPSAATVSVGGTQALTAVTKDAAGAVLTGRTVTWSTSNAAVATVSSAGVVTAVTAGSATITASSEGKTGTAAITVPVPAARYLVTASSSVPAAGETVTITAQLADVNGNAVAMNGKTVTWSKSNANGSFASATSTTNGSGIATVIFTVHTIAGTATTVTATDSDNLTGTTATITTVAGPPYLLSKNGGDEQRATVGTSVTTAPRVLVTDANANPVAGVRVTYVVASGGGSLTGATAITNASGIATVGSWTLGTTAGENALTAASGTLTGSPVTFTATGTAGATAFIQVVRGRDQVGVVSSPVDTNPAVRAVDIHGNRVPGVPFTASVTYGGGSIATTNAVTNVNGEATFGAWTLGSSEGEHTLEFSTPGFSNVGVLARAVPASSFFIDVRYIGNEAASYNALFQAAATRWQRAIIRDELNTFVNLPAGTACGSGILPSINETVDDILVFAEVVDIDGEGGTLASASACRFGATSLKPVVGYMKFDRADLTRLIAQGRARNTILHEMGHVLGFGSLTRWRDLLVGAGTSNPYFVGSNALSAFNALNAGSTSPWFGSKVPVEETGGAGTRDSHWRESVMNSELMTGYSGPTSTEPLSVVTLDAMSDLGYGTSLWGYNSFSIPALAIGTQPVKSAVSWEQISTTEIYIDHKTGIDIPKAAMPLQSRLIVPKPDRVLINRSISWEARRVPK